MLEIIAGKYRKRHITVKGKMRPPLQRLRISIFNLIDKYIDLENKMIVDICAGSGSFGLECISRGAQFVYFIEENKATANNLRSILSSWQINNASVVTCNVNYLPNSQTLPDILFFDPPFGHQYIESSVNRLIEKHWIKNQAILVLRTNYNTTFDGLNLLCSEKFGISYVYLYQGIKDNTSNALDAELYKANSIDKNIDYLENCGGNDEN